jgi:hypothetical protein
MIKHLYPPNWDELKIACKERANWQCEECGVKEGAIKWSRHSRRQYIVYLHAAHTDDDPGNSIPTLVCLCPSCHMRHDRNRELAERISQRRRGYAVTTTDRLLDEVRSAGVSIEETSDGYRWRIGDDTGTATTAVAAVGQALYRLRMRLEGVEVEG